MAKIYLYVEESDTTYSIICKKEGHADTRVSQRFIDNIIDDEFVAGRLCTLMQRTDGLSDTIVNCVRFGENFVLEDMQQRLSMAVYHQMNLLSVGTIFNSATGLRKYDGQKVIRIFEDGSFCTYTFSKNAPSKMEVAWA